MSVMFVPDGVNGETMVGRGGGVERGGMVGFGWSW